jgi:hypothetical protein
MLDRAIATQHAEIALDETETHTPRNVRISLRIFKERCSGLLRTIGEFVAAGGPLS